MKKIVVMSEVDSYGVAYHSRYLEWLEPVRDYLLKKHFKPLNALLKDGKKLPIIRAHVEWYKPIKLGDEVNITSFFKSASKTSFTMKHEFSVGDYICARAELTAVYLKNDKPSRLDAEFLSFIEGVNID